MLTYSFENLNGESLYEHLYNCIRKDIMAGVLKKDAKLPSKRELSKNLSISVMTIENAYNQLLSEGYIYSLPRKGFFVADIFNVDVPRRKTLAEEYETRTYVPDKKDESGRKKKEEESGEIAFAKAPTFFADFASNATDPDSFPFTIWAKLTRRILSENQEQFMTNSPSQGIYELRKAIADYLREFREMNVSPDNIVIGAGTEVIYTQLIFLLGRGVTYATEDPGYSKIPDLMDMYGVRHVSIPIDESGIQVEELVKSDASVVHTAPSHHFPTGITMPVKRRNELLRWAEKGKNKRFIIEDDYDSEFRLQGRPVPTLYSMDMSGNVIYMNTFTKSLASSIRISYMVLPDELMEIYRKNHSIYACTVSSFEQLTLARFISEGHYEKHINRMRTANRKKRDLLMSEIKRSPLAPYSSIREENSGLHFMLELNLKISDDTFVANAAKSGIHILPITSYGTGKPHHFLINYSSIPEEKIPEAVKRLGKGVR